eukprot:jgi/Ulvmu1/4310/UM002_0031.1
MMGIFPRRRKRNTLGDMASAAIANDDMPSTEPLSDQRHNSVSVQELLKQWIVTLVGAVIAFIVVSRLKPWDTMQAVGGHIMSSMLEAKSFWIFLLGVMVGSVVIPLLMAHLPHFFADMPQLHDHSWRVRGLDDVPSSHQFVPVWAEHGVMRGTVFTIPASRWTDSDTLPTPWPPPYQGKAAKFLKWSAFVEDGYLVMRQDGKNDLRISGEGLHCSVPMDARIALAGTVVDLLPEAYKEKGPWIRKAPLKLIFPGARDPYAEEAVVFFPNTAAEKEQWFLALSWAAKYDQLLALDPEHATLAAGLEAQRQYAQFSRHIRSTAPVMLPTALPPSAAPLTTSRTLTSGGSVSGLSTGSAGGGPRRRTWWGGRRKPRGASGGAMSAPVQPPTVPRQKTPQNRSQVVGDFIRDKQWGSQPMKQGLKPGEAGLPRVKGTLSVSKRSSSAQNLMAMAPPVTQFTPVIPPAAGEAGSPRAQRPHTSSSTSDLSAATMAPSMKAGLEHTASGTDILHCLEPSATSRRGAKARSSRHSSAGAIPAGDNAGSSAQAEAPSEGAPFVFAEADGLPAALFAGHGPSQLAGLHAVNMLLVRSAFDLLRCKRFHDPVQRRVQTRLSNITVPNFIAPLQLAGLDLGNTLPLIKSAHALPSPGKVLVPRLVMHIVYHGTCTLTIKTSINMKESAAAMAMDKTAEDLDRGLDGSSAAAVAAEASPDEAAAAELAGAALEDAMRVAADGAAEVPEAADTAETSVGGAAAEGPGKGVKGKRQGGLAMLGYRSIKNIMTGGVKRVMDSIAETVSGTNVTLEVSITELDGPVMIWMAPPPSNILWLSFLEPPKLKVSAKPLNVNAMVHYTAMAVKLTSWLERKIKQALQKNMVFPACTDIRMGFLMDHAELLTENLLSLEIPVQESKSDKQEKSNKTEKGKEDKALYDRSKSLADSFGASSVAAVAAQPCDSAPAEIAFPDDAEDVQQEGSCEQQQQAAPEEPAPVAHGRRSGRASMEQRPVTTGHPHKGSQASRQARQAERALAATARSSHPTRSRSDPKLDSEGPQATTADLANRRPFLRVFTHGIPRMLRRGPQQASPLQTHGPRLSRPMAAASDSDSVLKPAAVADPPSAHTAPLPTIAPQPEAASEPAHKDAAHANFAGPSTTAHADMATAAAAIDITHGKSKGRTRSRLAALSLSPSSAAAAVSWVTPSASSSRLPRPHSDAELRTLSPHRREASPPEPTPTKISDPPVVRSDPCLSTAARELGVDPCISTTAQELGISAEDLSDSPAPGAVRASPAIVLGLQSEAAADLGLQTDAATELGLQSEAAVGRGVSQAGAASPGLSDTVTGSANQPSRGGSSPAAARTPASRQSSQRSNAAEPTAAELLTGGVPAAPGASTAGQPDSSDADVSDGVAAVSDARTTESAATPDSSADEGGAADQVGSGSPAADARAPWYPMKLASDVEGGGSPSAAVLSNSAALASNASSTHASATASADAPVAGPSEAGRQGRTQSGPAGVAVGEAVRHVNRRSGHGEGDDDTTWSDDVRSVMSTVGAPSDLDSAVPSTPSASSPSCPPVSVVSEVPGVMADMMHQDPAQAALLQLHMLGKGRKIKKGSYIISSDGAVTRTKARPS